MNQLTKRNQYAFKLLSVLLDYPDRDWPTVNEWQQEILTLTNAEVIRSLGTFLDYLKTQSYDQLAQTYVSTFDFNKDTNLNLTYYKLGDHRERAALLVRLKECYRSEGLSLTTKELPDYLPILLEFLSISPPEAGIIVLNDYLASISYLHQSLTKTNSPYANLVEACLIAAADYIKEQDLKQKQA